MTRGLVLAVAVFTAVYGAVGVLALRRRLLARLAAREAGRRRGQSLLVIGGLMVGAAGITASLVGADSSQDSAILNAYRTWGRVDLTVVAGGRPFPAEVAGRLAADPEVRGATDGVQAGLELVGAVADLDRRQGEPAVRLIGFDPASQAAFGRFQLVDGASTTGDDLGPGEVLLSRGLASALQARPGDRLAATVETAAGATAPVPLTVAGIARSDGPGAYGLRPAVFAPLATLQTLAGTDRIDVVRISAPGGVRGGLDEAPRAKRALERALASLAASLPAGPEPEVREVKAAEVDQAKQSTAWTRAMLVGVSVLIVAAGSALVVNLAMMLAEERRPRLGVLRALGLTRGGLVRLSVLEGAIYSLLAAAIGTAVGVGAGRVISRRYAVAFSQFFNGETDFRYVFAPRPATLATAFTVGALVTLATVLLAARRTSRLTIAAAIRDLPEPAPEHRRRWPRVALLVALLAAGAAGVVQADRAARLAGGIALIVAGSRLVRRRLPLQLHLSLTGAVLAGWAFFIVSGLDASGDPNKFFSAFTAAALASVFGLSILAAANLGLLERVIGTLARSARLHSVLRPPLAYLARRPLRTGLSTGVFAVVLSVVTLLAVFLHMMKPQYERDSRGFDVRVVATGTAGVAFPADVGRLVEREVPVPTRGYVGALTSPFVRGETAFVPMYEATPEMVRMRPVRLSARLKTLGSDEAVWRAVARDPRLVIASYANPGDEITLRGAQGPVRLRVAANAQTGILDGVIGSREALAPFQTSSRGVVVMLDARPGTNAASLARRIERSLFAAGVDAASIRQLLDNGYRANRTFFSVVEVLMRMGLVIGVLTLGILGLRAVVERRRMIGVLRSLGYRRREVMAGLMAEAWITATIGVVVGFAAGAVMGYLFLRQFAEGTPYGMDGGSIGTALGLLYAAVIVVTIGPAWRASRLPPAEAVRLTE